MPVPPNVRPPVVMRQSQWPAPACRCGPLTNGGLPSFNLVDGLARVDPMSDDVRILTTHAGSLPRPAALTELFVRRTQDQPIDATALAEAGRTAVAWVVAKQRQAGLDIISNGEQQRESFVLYLRRRLSGIGGQGERAAFAD